MMFSSVTGLFGAAILLAAAITATGAFPAAAASKNEPAKPLRPPATPLVTHDPYFSIWSAHDLLTDGPTTHWTGKPHPMLCLLRVDGKVYRAMGPDPFYTPPMRQTRLEVTPTRSIYQMETDQVRMRLTFTSPCLPADLDVLSRPVTYVSWELSSNDGREHEVAVYFEISALLAVNDPEQKVVGSRPEMDGMTVMRIGSEEQPVLQKKGDNLRIDWGHLYVAAPSGEGLQSCIGNGDAGRGSLLTNRPLPTPDDTGFPRRADEAFPAAMLLFDHGSIGRSPVSRYLMLAYDDLYSIELFGEHLRPYWRRNGADAEDLLQKAARDHARLQRLCEQFDAEVMADLTAAGGRKYAEIGALAYRQCMAAGKLAADASGMPVYFSKECFSNGCTGTVDVIYPSSPQFLLFNPVLLKASLEPVLRYAASPRWKFPFAPHDIGTYPKASGQVYGGGENSEANQMPVEESGNMLLMVAAIARAEGNADYAAKHWATLAKWAEYLRSKGMDPEEQLCTDDFSGHLAHNVNLSAKSILALGAFADLCRQLDKKDLATDYRKSAEEFARRWVREADDGDHFRLAFDRPGTWSQKYNLVWDRVLGLGLFPASVAEKETRFYRTVQKRYGIPLDSRENWTKLDWVFWSASLTGQRDDFEALTAPVYDFLNESPSRVPMTDWYWVETGRMNSFQARPVVGGVFMNLLGEPAVWKKWAGRARPVKGEWAPLKLEQ